MVLGPKGQINYTRDGNFHLSMTEMGRCYYADGYPVLDEFESEIYLDDIDVSSLNVTEGDLTYTDEDGLVVPLGYRIGLVKFENREGLEK